jgi:hypothetical protein
MRLPTVTAICAWWGLVSDGTPFVQFLDEGKEPT